jgi:hypothetical protein
MKNLSYQARKICFDRQNRHKMINLGNFMIVLIIHRIAINKQLYQIRS